REPDIVVSRFMSQSSSYHSANSVGPLLSQPIYHRSTVFSRMLVWQRIHFLSLLPLNGTVLLGRTFTGQPLQQRLLAAIRSQPAGPEQRDRQADTQQPADDVADVADARIAIEERPPKVERQVKHDYHHARDFTRPAAEKPGDLDLVPEYLDGVEWIE